MSKKFCPFGFFTFYVNKSQAQAGACHHCVEDSCALWNEDYEECSLKVGLDAVANVADTFSGGGIPIPARPERKIETPKLSIFDKLRKKNEGTKLPIVETPQDTTSVTPPAPPPPAPIPTPAPAVPVTPHIDVSIDEPEKSADFLKPPDVPLDMLPVISINPEEK